MGVPEILYISKNIYGTFMYQVPDPDDEEEVEYIRKDTFIKKACQWLSQTDFCHYYNKEFINDFCKAMEE